MNVNDLILELNNLTFEQKKVFLESIQILENLDFSRKEYPEKSLKVIYEDTTPTMDFNSNNEAKINDDFEAFVSELIYRPIPGSNWSCVWDCLKKYPNQGEEYVKCFGHCVTVT